MPKECLTPAEVAKILGCTRKTVYRKIQSGRLPAFRLEDQDHGELRVATIDLLAFKERNKYRRAAKARGAK